MRPRNIFWNIENYRRLYDWSIAFAPIQTSVNFSIFKSVSGSHRYSIAHFMTKVKIVFLVMVFVLDSILFQPVQIVGRHFGKGHVQNSSVIRR